MQIQQNVGIGTDHQQVSATRKLGDQTHRFEAIDGERRFRREFLVTDSIVVSAMLLFFCFRHRGHHYCRNQFSAAISTDKLGHCGVFFRPWMREDRRVVFLPELTTAKERRPSILGARSCTYDARFSSAAFCSRVDPELGGDGCRTQPSATQSARCFGRERSVSVTPAFRAAKDRDVRAGAPETLF